MNFGAEEDRNFGGTKPVDFLRRRDFAEVKSGPVQDAVQSQRVVVQATPEASIPCH